jgi:hypothetical protein
LIIGAAAFARPGQTAINLAALLGSLAPDMSLYLMAGVSLLVLDIPARVVFGELYFSAAWQQVFAIDNSFVLWGLGLAIAIWARRPAWIAFAGAGVLHLAFDFPLHHDDARQHFWPLSNWVFESPLSYWDGRHYGNIIGPLEVALCLGLLVLLWRRFVHWPTRALVLAGGAVQVAPVVIWGLVFST